MKKPFNKIKTWVATLWIAIVSSFSKVFGQQAMYWVENPFDPPMQEAYWPYPISQPSIIIKLAKWPLIAIAFIVWIISLIKIREIEDKTQKKKKIKRTIITISILVVLIIACLLLPVFLKKY